MVCSNIGNKLIQCASVYHMCQIERYKRTRHPLTAILFVTSVRAVALAVTQPLPQDTLSIRAPVLAELTH